MSKRELGRVEVLARVRSRDLRVVDAGALMRVSYRQAKRLWKRYREEGAAGLKHRSAGRRSNRAYPERFRRQVLGRVREKYGGPVGERFGPTLAAEHLAAEDGLRVEAETLRRWMLGEGLWSRERRRRRHRRRRERQAHLGEMVQMDGSFHRWLEGRGPEGCLMDLVDDATGTTLARLGEQETIGAAADALRGWIESYGVPLALYVDWKNLYQRGVTPRERLRGEEPITQFGRMGAKLGIELIAASSPQAKGRVERTHGTHQDRRVKKLRRKKIDSQERANGYLEAEYLPEHNRRFARPAAQAEDYHRRAPPNWTGSSAWRASARSATIGWCVTTTGSSNCSRRAATTRRPKARGGCAKGGTRASRSNIGAAACRGSRSRPLPGRVSPRGGPLASGQPRRPRRSPSGSGCRRRTTRGGRPPARAFFRVPSCAPP